MHPPQGAERIPIFSENIHRATLNTNILNDNIINEVGKVGEIENGHRLVKAEFEIIGRYRNDRFKVWLVGKYDPELIHLIQLKLDLESVMTTGQTNQYRKIMALKGCG